MHSFFSQEFITVAIIHFLAAASPGPDFAIVLKNSVTHGRKIGVATSLGIALGLMVHILYCIIGLGIVISKSIIAFNIIKFAGAAYLIYVGFNAIRAKKFDLSASESKAELKNLTIKQALWSGFLTNVLNPKVTLFFLAIFSVTISPMTPTIIKIGYGVWMMMVTALWFSLLSTLFSQNLVRRLLDSVGHWFERIMGGILILLGLKLAFTQNR